MRSIPSSLLFLTQSPHLSSFFSDSLPNSSNRKGFFLASDCVDCNLQLIMVWFHFIAGLCKYMEGVTDDVGKSIEMV
ncbi:hypothetical protein Hanom_Chr03g00266581 [Helianthus anomalus]